MAVVLVTGGCIPAGESAVQAAADSFQVALGAGDDNAACGWLSEEARGNLESASGKPCARALSGLGLPTGSVRSVEVWGGNAQARLDAGVFFLAEFKAGWRITAAGCQPRQDKPYDCDVEG